MAGDQHYRLVESWAANEWPLDLDTDTLHELNTVAPTGYHYADIPSPDADAPRVELYEYVGEMPSGGDA